MTFGVIILAHEALHRVEAVARFWGRHGCPVAIHICASVPEDEAQNLRSGLSAEKRICFTRRRRCRWGTWSIVRATQEAAEELLSRHPDLGHVLLTSGACLPIRPVEELRVFLHQNKGTDFIESVRAGLCTWAQGGLDRERFTLHFPFPWKGARPLFDMSVGIQRRLGVERRMPPGVTPHLGSQWWCLTAGTLKAILAHPDRARIDRYFQTVWIPDESYFQTMTRQVSDRIESRSLTYARFDANGTPHIFYDDHADHIASSRKFILRKVWPGADRLYERFLSDGARVPAAVPPGDLDVLVERARHRRTRGRPGVINQGRFPHEGWDTGLTARSYGVLGGFDAVFGGFDSWAAERCSGTLHGHLFAEGGAEFAGGGEVGPGGLSAAPRLRDYALRAFLANLVRATDPTRQVFRLGPSDTPEIHPVIAGDPNARIVYVTGTWAVTLAGSAAPTASILRTAARLQRIELQLRDTLLSPGARARTDLFCLADVARDPARILSAAHAALSDAPAARLLALPQIADLSPVWPFLRQLRNAGLNPRVFGPIPEASEVSTQRIHKGSA